MHDVGESRQQPFLTLRDPVNVLYIYTCVACGVLFCLISEIQYILVHDGSRYPLNYRQSIQSEASAPYRCKQSTWTNREQENWEERPEHAGDSMEVVREDP